MDIIATLPLPAVIGIFLGASAIVWLAGVRLARWADALATRTGIGAAVLGIVLLGGITSLPEVAVSVTASLRGEAALAVNNLLGGLSFQVAILAIADRFVGRDALTSVNAEPVVLLQGTLVCIMLTVTALAIGVGDTALPFGVGAWALSLLPLYGLSVFLIGRFRGRRTWRPAERHGNAAAADDLDRDGKPSTVDPDEPSMSGLLLRIAGAAVAILAAGAAATLSAEGIAKQTGMGTSFVGAVLLAGATSMPELSTAIEAVRLRRYTMAFGDVFGTNLIDVVLILLVDALSSGGPVINGLGPFSLVAALIGVLLTMIYVVGLIERHDRVVGGIGLDSIAVLGTYGGGLYLLYRLQ